MKHRSLEIIRDEHSSLAAMLQSMRMLVDRGRRATRRTSSTCCAPCSTSTSFPSGCTARKRPSCCFPAWRRPRSTSAWPWRGWARDHEYTEHAVREIQHLLLGWGLLGEARRQVFVDAFTKYVNLYLAHMRLEEQEILPAAEKYLSEADWKLLDAAFEEDCDPLTGKYKPDPVYEQLFSRIVREAPAPIGLGGG